MPIDVRIMGHDPAGNDPLEAWTTLAGVPRAGDQLSVWVCDRGGEVYAEVENITWPTWQYAHDPGEQAPVVFLRRTEGTDEEWLDLFAAIKDKRHP